MAPTIQTAIKPRSAITSSRSCHPRRNSSATTTARGPTSSRNTACMSSYCSSLGRGPINLVTNATRSAVTKSKYRKNKGTKKRKAAARKPKPFRLFDRPQELIDMVYRSSLRSGNINILSTSRAVHVRASQFIIPDSFYRISVNRGTCGVHYVTRARSLGKLYDVHSGDSVLEDDIEKDRKAKSIQNFEVRFLPTSGLAKPLRGICPHCRLGRAPNEFSQTDLAPFMGSAVHRGLCRIVVETNISDHRHWKIQKLYEMLRELAGFAFLNIIYSPKWGGGHSKDAWSSKGQLAVYKVIKEQLEPTLGPATPADGRWELREGLQFSPLQYKMVLKGL